MIVDKELSVSNRKKVEIIAELRRKDFRPFPKAAKATAATVNEEDEEEEEADGATVKGNSDYDYLLGMPIWSLTKEKVG
jgi:DNA topoisomerase-2